MDFCICEESIWCNLYFIINGGELYLMIWFYWCLMVRWFYFWLCDFVWVSNELKILKGKILYCFLLVYCIINILD